MTSERPKASVGSSQHHYGEAVVAGSLACQVMKTMAHPHGNIDFVNELVSGSTAANSLLSGAAVPVASGNKRTALERDFTMSRIELDAYLKTGNTGAESSVYEDIQAMLCLYQGIADATDMAASMTINRDFTPAEGDSTAGADKAIARVCVLRIPFEVVGVVHDEAADVIRVLQKATYVGPPLRQGKPWTFPKNEGWQWGIFNFGEDSLAASTKFSAHIRSMGVFSN